MFQLVDTIAQQRGAHALRAGIDLVHNDDTITFPRAVRGSYAFSSLATSWPAPTTTPASRRPSATPSSQQGSTSVGLYVQDEWSATPRLTLNLGLRYDLQCLETIDTDTNNVSPRAGFAWTPLRLARPGRARQCRALLRPRAAASPRQRAALGRQHNRPVQAAAAQHRPLARASGRAGLSRDPAGAGAVGDALHLTTMQRDLQNAYSRQASLEVERQVGQRRHGQRRLLVSARRAPADVDQPERAVVRRRRHQQRLPADGRLRQQQPVPLGRRVHLPRAAAVVGPSGRPPGATTAPATRGRRPRTTSASSSSAAPSIRSTCRRTGAAPTTTAATCWSSRAASTRRSTPADSTWQRLTHGFQLSTLLQAYSAAPFNITSGVTTVQGTAGRPIVNGAVHPAQLRRGRRVLHREPAGQPRLPRGADRCTTRSGRRSVQPDEHRERDRTQHDVRRRRPIRRVPPPPSTRSPRWAIRGRGSWRCVCVSKRGPASGWVRA